MICSITTSISKKTRLLSLMGERLQHIFSTQCNRSSPQCFCHPKILIYLLWTADTLLPLIYSSILWWPAKQNPVFHHQHLPWWSRLDPSYSSSLIWGAWHLQCCTPCTISFPRVYAQLSKSCPQDFSTTSSVHKPAPPGHRYFCMVTSVHPAQSTMTAGAVASCSQTEDLNKYSYLEDSEVWFSHLLQ